VSSRSSSNNGNSYSHTARQLITTDEFANINDFLDNGRQGDITAVVFKRGMRPVPMVCEPYFKSDWMVTAAEPNPFLGEQVAPEIEGAYQWTGGAEKSLSRLLVYFMSTLLDER